MKKLFFVLLVLLAGAAVIFAVPAAHPPGGFATEAVFTGSAVTVNPVVVVGPCNRAIQHRIGNAG